MHLPPRRHSRPGSMPWAGASDAAPALAALVCCRFQMVWMELQAAGSCSRCTDCAGTNQVDGKTGNNKWIPGSPSNQTYLLLDDGKKAGDAIDQLLCQPPKNGPRPLV